MRVSTGVLRRWNDRVKVRIVWEAYAFPVGLCCVLPPSGGWRSEDDAMGTGGGETRRRCMRCRGIMKNNGCEWVASSGEPGWVSVIIPTFNRAVLLREALDSIAAQTYQPIEIIVVDDGSTDGTDKFVLAWARQYQTPDRTVHLIRQTRQGAPAARNRGASRACGEYIQFWDSDDLMLPEKIAASVAAMSSQACAYAVCDASVWDGGMVRRTSRLAFSHKAENPLADTSRPLNTIVTLYRRSLLREMGPWNESLACAQDWEFTMRLATLQVRGVAVGRELVRIRATPGSLSRQPIARTYRARLRACRATRRWAGKRGPLSPEVSEMIGRHMAAISRQLVLAGEHRRAHLIYRQARPRIRVPKRWVFDIHRWIQQLGGAPGMARWGWM